MVPGPVRPLTAHRHHAPGAICGVACTRGICPGRLRGPCVPQVPSAASALGPGPGFTIYRGFPTLDVLSARRCRASLICIIECAGRGEPAVPRVRGTGPLRPGDPVGRSTSTARSCAAPELTAREPLSPRCSARIRWSRRGLYGGAPGREVAGPGSLARSRRPKGTRSKACMSQATGTPNPELKARWAAGHPEQGRRARCRWRARPLDVTSGTPFHRFPTAGLACVRNDEMEAPPGEVARIGLDDAKAARPDFLDSQVCL